jgi:hypothetical protein
MVQSPCLVEDDDVLHRNEVVFQLFGRFGGGAIRQLTASPLDAYDDISLLEAYWKSDRRAPYLKIGLRR